MGRRKIEIRPIKDDRNRSVTFLKRKGGLFKKAYELGVLCSVDVAVIIFGNNKKLYEFSSGDINDTIGRFQYVRPLLEQLYCPVLCALLTRPQYAGAHEHKGPVDFAGKGGADDDDEDEENVGSPPPDSHSPPEPAMMPNHLHRQPSLQHMRHVTPSSSPPIPTGAFPQHRTTTPQPPGGALSRPSSRASHASHLRRASSQLALPPHATPPQAGAPQPGYAYQPNPAAFYSVQQASAMQRGTPQPSPQIFHYSHPPPSHAQMQQAHQAQQAHHAQQQHHAQQHQAQQAHQAQQQHQAQQLQAQQAHQAQQQAHQAFMQEHQRRQSVPAGFVQAPPPQHQSRQPSPQPPQHSQQARPGSSLQPEQGLFQSPPLPQPRPLTAHANSHSIFTPIEDSRSLLAQHWANTNMGDLKSQMDGPRSQSIDVAVMGRGPFNAASPRIQQVKPQMSRAAQHVEASASMPNVRPPARSDTSQSDAKRPRLKVQIPSEQSDGESPTGDSSPRDTSISATGATPHGSKNVVLPPPSPSTNNALHSAGASGPPNPFARPAAPASSNPHVKRDQIETPLSALPSRVMDGQMLPSPSDMWSTAWYNRNTADMLPSPLNFQPTPIVANGPSFRDEPEGDRKRRAEEAAAAENAKRIRT